VLEAAIVLPVIIVLTVLVIQYALLWHGRHVAQAAAQDGLQAASAYSAAPAAGQTAAAAYLAQVAPRLLHSPGVTVSATATTVTVTVHAEVMSLLAFGRFGVTEHAAGPRELFVTPAGDRR
jgi:Flp pilus assembly protein TadG